MMLRWVNAVGVVAGLVLGALSFVWSDRPRGSGVVRASDFDVGAQLRIETAPDGTRSLLDATGTAVELKRYNQIASGSTVVDHLLLELISPERIAAFTTYSRQNALFGHRYEGKPQIDALKDLERLLQLKADLLIVSTVSAPMRIERLREAGLNVFVLDELRGVAEFIRSAHAVAELVGNRELGSLYVTTFLGRLSQIADDVTEADKKSALQLTYYGKKVFSSGRRTSYADVLRYAGLVDVGSKHFEGWPTLGFDQVLELDPDIIVTREGMGKELCSQDALTNLRACHAEAGSVVELPEALLNDPGPGILPAAELLHRAVFHRNPAVGE